MRKILATHGKARTKAHSALKKEPQQKRPSRLDAHCARIDELLKEFPAITAQRVFAELKVEGYAGVKSWRAR